jgi:hypothetical protein
MNNFMWFVVQLPNGRFWAPNSPRGNPSPHAAMSWGRGATHEKICHDIEALCYRYQVVPPKEFEVKTIVAQVMGRIT